MEEPAVTKLFKEAAKEVKENAHLASLNSLASLQQSQQQMQSQMAQMVHMPPNGSLGAAPLALGWRATDGGGKGKGRGKGERGKPLSRLSQDYGDLEQIDGSVYHKDLAGYSTPNPKFFPKRADFRMDSANKGICHAPGTWFGECANPKCTQRRGHQASECPAALREEGGKKWVNWRWQTWQIWL